jgi:hypothetical protein
MEVPLQEIFNATKISYPYFWVQLQSGTHILDTTYHFENPLLSQELDWGQPSLHPTLA